MNVLVLGGDGYLGWPTSMYFSAKGHNVACVDNYFKREIAKHVNGESLTPIQKLLTRTQLWHGETGKVIQPVIGDVTDPSKLDEIIRDFHPDVVIHYAEQPSGPWSMVSQKFAATTITNNLISTLNLAYSVYNHAPDCHIIKLGTMGEYGSPNTDFPEGWWDYEINGRADRRLFPREAGSLYHTTKIMDTDMLWFYVRSWGLRVTDLMQGPVYGLDTYESVINPDLTTSFHYDEIFGTVLNRFLVQAAIGYPLTVYGKGEQIKGYLNIKDTLRCVEIAAENTPPPGTLEVYNQIVETFSVNQLADRVQTLGQKLGLDVTIRSLTNPRVEKEEYYYNPKYSKLKDLGLEPHYLTDEVLVSIMERVIKLCESQKVNEECIFKGYKWRYRD